MSMIGQAVAAAILLLPAFGAGGPAAIAGDHDLFEGLFVGEWNNIILGRKYHFTIDGEYTLESGSLKERGKWKLIDKRKLRLEPEGATAEKFENYDVEFDFKKDKPILAWLTIKRIDRGVLNFGRSYSFSNKENRWNFP
jgi:hypothetical protein